MGYKKCKFCWKEGIIVEEINMILCPDHLEEYLSANTFSTDEVYSEFHEEYTWESATYKTYLVEDLTQDETNSK